MNSNDLSPELSADLAASIYDALKDHIGLKLFKQNHEDKLEVSEHNIHQVVTDINISARTTPHGGMAYAGFVKVIEELRQPINDFLASAGKERATHTFHCIGHSLGGAVAHLAAEQLKAGKGGTKRNVKLYTVGSPRVGENNFSRSYIRFVLNTFWHRTMDVMRKAIVFNARRI